MVNDEPAFLPVGTEVSAKYKGAFCEAKIKKVQRSVKCRVSFKNMLGGTVVVADDQVRGSLKVGALIEAKHPDKPGVFQEATVTKIIDQSQYTVVFDDGDVTTLRRNSLCLKSGKHYSDGESLDQLPLTNPEHFSAPVAPGSVGSSCGSGNGSGIAQTRDSPAGKVPNAGSAPSQRKKRTAASLGEFLCREGGAADGGSSQEDDELEATTPRRKRQQQLQQILLVAGTVVLVEAERREDKTPRGGGSSDTYRNKRDALAAPALIVREQSGARKDEVRVKLFRDGQMITVPKKDVQEFDRKQTSLKGHPQKSAIFKALVYLEKGDLPQGWSRRELLDENAEDKDDDSHADDEKNSRSKSDSKDEENKDKDSDKSKGESDEDESESEDEVSAEERDRFVAQLYKFMEERGTPINKGPVLNGKDIDLHQLFSLVRQIGSFDKVTNLNRWRDVYAKMFKEPRASPSQGQQLKGAYKKYLQGFEDLYRKLGMDSHLDAKASGSGGGRSQRIMTRNKQPPLSAVKAGGRQERKAATPPQPPDSPSSASSGKRERLQQQQQQQQQLEQQKQHQEQQKQELEQQRQQQELQKQQEQQRLEQQKLQQQHELFKQEQLKQQQQQQELQKQEQQQHQDLPKQQAEKATVDKEMRDLREDEDKRSLTRSNKQLTKPEDREAAGLSTPKRVRSDSLDPAKRAKDKAVPPSAQKESKTKDDKERMLGTPVSVKKDRRREKGSDSEESEQEAPPSTRKGIMEPLRVNDRIRVKYGHGKQHKVYEAKVLKIEDIEGDSGEKKFFVHYTGWNNRYDEWIHKKRILENITHKLDKGRSSSVSAKKMTAPSLATNERERRDDKESFSSSSEKGDSKSSDSIKDLKDKDTKDQDNGAGSGPLRKKEEDSIEEPRKRRGKPPKKFAESSFEVHIPTRKDATLQTKDSKDKEAGKDAVQGIINKKDDDIKEKDSPSRKMESRDIKEEKGRVAKEDKTTKDSKELPVIFTDPGMAQTVGIKEERKEAPVAESPAPAPVKKLVEVSPEHAARVFAVKSKPPESSPPPVSISVQGTQGVLTTPHATSPSEKGKERDVTLLVGIKDKEAKESRESLTDLKKDRPAEDEPAGKEKPTTPKRARLAKRKKPATPSSEKMDKVQKIDKTEDKSDGGASVDKSAVSQAPCIKVQIDEVRQASLGVKDEQSEGEDTDIEKDLVVPTLLPLPATTAVVAFSSNESQLVEEDDEGDEETLKPCGGGAEEEASTEVEEGHLEDSLAENQSMNLDESGIEALEQETPVPPPTPNEEAAPQVALPAATSTPGQLEERRSTRAPIESAASPITTKIRKPRARRVSESRDEDCDAVEPKEKESREKKDAAKVASDKEEKPEEKRPATGTKSRVRKTSENQTDEDTLAMKKRVRKVSEMTLSSAPRITFPKKEEFKSTEAAIIVAVQSNKGTVDETKQIEPVIKHASTSFEDKVTEIRTGPILPRQLSLVAGFRPTPKETSGSSSAIVIVEKDKPREEKTTKEIKDKDIVSSQEVRAETAPVHYLPKKRRIQQKLDEEANALPSIVVAKKARIEEPAKVEIMKQELKEMDAVSDTSEEKMFIAEDTEDCGDDASIDKELDAKDGDRLANDRPKESKIISLNKETTSKVVVNKENDYLSRDSKEKERREEKERAAAGDALAALANACGEAEVVKEEEGSSPVIDKEIKQEEQEGDTEGADAGEQAGGLFLICEENVLPESPVPHNQGQANQGDSQDGPADGAAVLGGGRLGEMQSACCVTEVTPPTTPDDSQSSGLTTGASGVNVTPAERRAAIATIGEKSGDKTGEQRVGNASAGHGTVGNTGGPDEESTMSADSSDSARQLSAVEREREKSARGGKGGLSSGTRGGRIKRTRKTLRQKAQQGQAQRRAGAERARSPDGHSLSGGFRGSDRDGAPLGTSQGGAGQLGRHAGLLCAQMPPNYDPAKPPRFNFNLPIGEVEDVEERIGIIQERLCELKKTYMALKAEVALIDRKRKRIRRREAARAENSVSSSPRPHPSPLRAGNED
ncbi:hypothetical protein BIW11_08835 [Tropilaelaps mercedesae]|uniref:ARID domain-containing protein n=1 Tax=Tropilaelaps mercedesae TaxID=418985 RepID=A0A1V9XMR6_9ACAR|nr:hypothetical protein BIW11_08835 [Tropilaelaps mercedesae]